MNEEEAKQILDDPKKILDLFRVFHQLIHVYEAQEMKKQIKNQLEKKPGSIEKMGLSDSVDVQVTHPDSNSNKSQEDK